MPNRLAQELSPYLLQHARNPVDWYPWGSEAFSVARAEDKPIFLSIGYASCHWCHVMAHESFEDRHIARRLNEHFVPVKVDREERPEVDQIYMEAVQLMTRRGGWPLSVFLTPSLEPFFGGTYWPPVPRMGMPGFGEVLDAVIRVWRERREEVVQHAAQVTRFLQDEWRGAASAGAVDGHFIEAAVGMLTQAFDWQHGGFGSAPKFPQPTDLRLLLRSWKRQGRGELLDMVTLALDNMAGGGIYDHLGGGFHRYSTDSRWIVPHFEKMLYDNALLATCYLEAWQITGKSDYARVVRETLDYVLQRLTAPEGGFYSAEDADSEGQEGRFYLWTPEEIASVLGPQAARTFCAVYDVSHPGNYEGRNVLHLARPLEQCADMLGCPVESLQEELAQSRARLLAHRRQRVAPGVDDKILTSWNGLMIDAMARAAAALGEVRFQEAAVAAARLVLDELRTADGQLLHCWRHGTARHSGYLEDYASLAAALVTLYETQFDERWIDEAAGLVDQLLERFRDRAGGGFFFTAHSHGPLVARKKDMIDNVTPSGGGLAVWTLLRLGRLTGRTEYLDEAQAVLEESRTLLEHALAGTSQLLLALDLYLGPASEIVLLGGTDRADTAALLADLRRRFLPRVVVAFREADRPEQGRSPLLAGLFAGKKPIPPGPTLFVCHQQQCQDPVSGLGPAAKACADLASR